MYKCHELVDVSLPDLKRFVGSFLLLFVTYWLMYNHALRLKRENKKCLLVMYLYEVYNV